jgi:hypothetical protein
VYTHTAASAARAIISPLSTQRCPVKIRPKIDEMVSVMYGSHVPINWFQRSQFDPVDFDLLDPVSSGTTDTRFIDLFYLITLFI